MVYIGDIYVTPGANVIYTHVVQHTDRTMKTTEYVKRGTEKDWEVYKKALDRANSITEVEIDKESYNKVLEWMDDFMKIYDEGIHWNRSKERRKGADLMYGFFKNKIKLKAI